MDDILSQEMMTKVSLSSTSSKGQQQQQQHNEGEEEEAMAVMMMMESPGQQQMQMAFETPTKVPSSSMNKDANTPGTVDMSFETATYSSPEKQQQQTMNTVALKDVGDAPPNSPSNSTGSSNSVGRVVLTRDGVCIKVNNKTKTSSSNHPDAADYVPNITAVPTDTSSNDNTINSATLVTCDWLPDQKREALQASTGWGIRKENEDEKQQRKKHLEEAKNKKQQRKSWRMTTTRKSTTIPDDVRVANKTTTSFLAKKQYDTPTISAGTSNAGVTKNQKQSPFHVANKTTTSWLAKKQYTANPTTDTSGSSRIRTTSTTTKNQPKQQPFEVANKTTTSWLAKKHHVVNPTNPTSSIPTSTVVSSKKRKQVTPFNVANKTTKSWLAKHHQNQNKDDDDTEEDIDHYHHHHNNNNISCKKRKVTVPAVANKATASWLAKHQPEKEEEDGVDNNTTSNNRNEKWKPTIPKEDVASYRPTFSFLSKKKSNTDDGGRATISCPRVLNRMKKFKKRLMKGIIKPKNYTPSMGTKESTACSISNDADCTKGVFPQQHHYHKFTHSSSDDTVSLLSMRSTTSSNLKQKHVESFSNDRERSQSPLLYKGFLLGDTNY